MKSVLAAIATIAVAASIIAGVYLMMMVGWLIVCAVIAILIISGIYAVIKSWFTSTDDHSDEKNPPK